MTLMSNALRLRESLSGLATSLARANEAIDNIVRQLVEEGDAPGPEPTSTTSYSTTAPPSPRPSQRPTQMQQTALTGSVFAQIIRARFEEAGNDEYKRDAVRELFRKGKNSGVLGDLPEGELDALEKVLR